MLGSSWQGDFAAGGLLRLGYRFARVVAIDAVVWEQLGVVDSRFLTGLTLGVTGTIPLKRVRPEMRLFSSTSTKRAPCRSRRRPAG